MAGDEVEGEDDPVAVVERPPESRCRDISGECGRDARFAAVDVDRMRCRHSRHRLDEHVGTVGGPQPGGEPGEKPAECDTASTTRAPRRVSTSVWMCAGRSTQLSRTPSAGGKPT